jgi:DNA polymerase III epsilon subunit-like protein
MKIIVFDTETTGLPETKIISPDTVDKWPTIVQFSYLIYDTIDNYIINMNDFIVKVPDNIIISEESSNIHKITNEISTEQGIKIEEVLFKFFKDLENIDKIIGHNINFDINMIKVELLRIIYRNYEFNKVFKGMLFKITNFKNINCTLQDSINLCNIEAKDKCGKTYLKFPKLVELHEKLFNSKPNNLHDSLIDILVTLRCFMKMKYNVDLLNVCNTFINISNKLKIF